MLKFLLQRLKVKLSFQKKCFRNMIMIKNYILLKDLTSNLSKFNNFLRRTLFLFSASPKLQKQVVSLWKLTLNLLLWLIFFKRFRKKCFDLTYCFNSAWNFQLVLQDNIKEVFDSVLNHETVPLVVHYLFGVLENLANKNSVEPDTLLCWKSER